MKYNKYLPTDKQILEKDRIIVISYRPRPKTQTIKKKSKMHRSASKFSSWLING